MTETLACGYSSKGTQRELSNEYQHDRVKMVFINLCILALWIKVASALEGLTVPLEIVVWIYDLHYEFTITMESRMALQNICMRVICSVLFKDFPSNIFTLCFHPKD